MNNTPIQDAKKKLGQYFTQPAIAAFMAQQAYFDGAKTVLDPAVGPGALIEAMKKQASKPLHYTVYDLDEGLLSKTRALLSDSHEIRCGDYLLSGATDTYDIILCNPPYNRFQDIPNRKEYLSVLAGRYGIQLGGHANLCVYFLMKSLQELNPGGRLVYIMPYEFFNTGYGIEIKRIFLQDRKLKKVIRFDSTIQLFSDAVTTSCILVFENKKQDVIEFQTVNSLDSIVSKPGTGVKTICHAYDRITPEEKWNSLFLAEDGASGNTVPFSQHAIARRGIATGSNSYFMLNRAQMDTLGISDNSTVNCICKAPELGKDTFIFSEDDFRALDDAGRKVHLFNGCEASAPGDFAYISQGEKMGVQKAYLTSHRTPWFQIEHRDVAPIWISAFHRGGLKIIRNESSAKNLTAFHGIYLHTQDAADINVFFCYLLTETAQGLLRRSLREYGNGLLKFEPNDINHSHVLDVSKLPPAARKQVLEIYEKLRSKEDHTKDIQNLERIFQNLR